MIDKGIVQGSEVQAQPIVIGTDTVYVHTDIIPAPDPENPGETIEGLYQYHEVQYDKDEYITLMDEQVRTQHTLMNILMGVTDDE